MATLEEQVKSLQSQLDALVSGMETGDANEKHNKLADEANLQWMENRLTDLEDVEDIPFSLDNEELPDPENPFYGEGGDEEDYPLEVIIDPDEPLRVAVRGGNWTVCNRVNSGSTDYDITGSTTDLPLNVQGTFVYSGGEASLSSHIAVSASDLSTNTTYYVYARLETADDAGDAAKATRMNVYLATTEPRESALGYQNDSIRVLRVVTTDSSAIPTLGDVWTRGNIKTQPMTLDSGDPIHTESGEKRESIEVDDKGRLSLRRFHQANEGKVPYPSANSGSNKDLLWDWIALFQTGGLDPATNGGDHYINDPSLAGGGAAWAPPGTTDYRFLDFAQGTYAVGDRFPGSVNFTDAGGQILIDLWNAIYGYVFAGHLIHPHEDHTFNSDDHNNEGKDRYLINTGTAARNNMRAGSGIGDNVGALSLSPADRTLVLPWAATDATAASTGGLGAFKVPNGGIFGGGNLVIDNSLTGGPAADFYHGGGTINAAFALPSKAGYFLKGSQSMDVADGTNAATATGNIEITGTTGDYKHDSKTGHTDAANEISGGLVVGGAGLPGGSEFEAAVEAKVNDILGGYGLI